MMQDLQKLSGLDKNDEEAEALTDLNEKVRLFISSNQQCLDLGVLNTNVKATRLCWGDFKNVVGQILALTDKVMNDADNSVPAVISNKSNAGDAARRRKLAYDMAKTALVLHRTLKLHIETNSSQPGFRADRPAGDRAQGPAQPVSHRTVAPAAAQRCRGVGGRPFRDE